MMMGDEGWDYTVGGRRVSLYRDHLGYMRTAPSAAEMSREVSRKINGGEPPPGPGDCSHDPSLWRIYCAERKAGKSEAEAARVALDSRPKQKPSLW